MAMDSRYALAATTACICLSFCIASAITAQALHSWWQIENVSRDNATYNFGLYYICMKSENQTCFQFNAKGMNDFTAAHSKAVDSENPILIAENLKFQSVWMLSFFAILFTGVAFLMSIPIMYQSFFGEILVTASILQATFTAIGVILGVTTVVYAYEERDAIWPTGVELLKTLNIGSGKVISEGLAFTFQCIYSAVEVIPFLIYLFLACQGKKASKNVV